VRARRHRPENAQNHKKSNGPEPVSSQPVQRHRQNHPAAEMKKRWQNGNQRNDRGDTRCPVLFTKRLTKNHA